MEVYPGLQSFQGWKLLSPPRIILRHFLNYFYFRECIKVAFRLSEHLSMLQMAVKLKTIRLDLFSFIIRNKIKENQKGLSIKVHWLLQLKITFFLFFFTIVLLSSFICSFHRLLSLFHLCPNSLNFFIIRFTIKINLLSMIFAAPHHFCHVFFLLLRIASSFNLFNLFFYFHLFHYLFPSIRLRLYREILVGFTIN